MILRGAAVSCTTCASLNPNCTNTRLDNTLKGFNRIWSPEIHFVESFDKIRTEFRHLTKIVDKDNKVFI